MWVRVFGFERDKIFSMGVRVLEKVKETERRVLSIKDICQAKMLMHARSQVRL